MVFIVGLIGMLLFILLTKTPFPPRQLITAAPLYGYLGGIIVATYVIMITVLVPKIGVGTAIGLIVTGQIICAVIIDHFGLFNVAVRSINLSRSIGIVLMIVGVYLGMKK
jgi:transporter family-2 protein